MAGAVVQWLRDGLGIISSSGEVEALALRVKTTDGVYLVPAFVGLGAPHWDQHARAAIVGMSRGTNSAHIARAALESIAYQTLEVLKAMEADASITIEELRVDGGATANNLLMQFQSDILGTKVVKPGVTEVTAIGAAYLAGLATGYWKSVDEIRDQWKIHRAFTPGSDLPNKELIGGWKLAVQASKQQQLTIH
jgi:glycerol kinase